MAMMLALAIAAQAVPDGEAALEAMLAGRVEGAPLTCVSPRSLRGSRIVDGTAIIYEGNGSRLYVQRPTQGAEQLRSGDTIVSRSTIGSLCRTDIADLVDRSTRIRTGFVTFGRFVPYDKPKRR
jgi:hypothetical protein